MKQRRTRGPKLRRGRLSGWSQTWRGLFPHGGVKKKSHSTASSVKPKKIRHYVNLKNFFGMFSASSIAYQFSHSITISTKYQLVATSVATGNFVREWTVRDRPGNFSSGNGRYGKVREIFRTGMDGTGILEPCLTTTKYPPFLSIIIQLSSKIAEICVKNSSRMKFEGLFYGICWFGIVREILFGNGRYGKVREILGPGMDGTGMYGKFFVREWTVREVREFPYRTGNFPYRGNTSRHMTTTAWCLDIVSAEQHVDQ